MAYWSIALLLVSVSFLAYRHPPAALEQLPRWIRPARRREGEDTVKDRYIDAGKEFVGNGTAKGPELKIDDQELLDGEGTPKAKAAGNDVAVPTFSLDEDAGLDKDRSPFMESNKTPSALLAAPTSPSAISMPPPPKPKAPSPQQNGANLMPPPPRPMPNSITSLRVPSTGPLPNRGLPANSQQRVNSGLSVSNTTSTPNARGKVLLSPGHSPMDWAALTRTGNLSGVNTFQRVTPSVLKSMTGRKGKPAWSSWQGKVYNLTPYLPFHPGGEPEIMKAAGRDGTKLFLEVHPWVNWENMLGACLVGVLVPEDYGSGGVGEGLEDMD